MTKHVTRAELQEWQLDLAARFGARRCRCGAPATVVVIGSASVRGFGFLIATSKPDRNLCALHAGLLAISERAA
jgi:hypothetical protein